MNRRRCEVAGWALFGLLLLATLTFPPVASADEPMLAIRLIDGESAFYTVSEIDRIGFEGEDTLVVVTASGSDNYATESIERIEFLWGLSSVKDPRDAASLIRAIHLFQNQPNPFSPETRIGFELPRTGQVELTIYDVQGRLIHTLVDQELGPGAHEVRWDGRDQDGQKVSSGVYFYNLLGPGIEESRRMILLP